MFDSYGVQMLFRKGLGHSQFEVSDTLGLIRTNGDPMSMKTLKLYGVGLGYSVKTSNAFVSAEKSLNTRADGVKLYHTVVAEVLLKLISLRRMKVAMQSIKPIK